MAFNNSGIMTHEERQAVLDGMWREHMPCWNCDIKDVCKYCNSIKRPDFNPDVFIVNVVCKIRSGYRRNNNGQ